MADEDDRLARARSLVDALEAELMRRRVDIERHDAYYRGEHPLEYASDQFRKYHGDRYKGFSDNWVQVVADSPVERLTVRGIVASEDAEADKETWRVLQSNGFDADSQLGFLGAVNSARSFVLVWGDPDNPDTPEVTFEDASTCIVAYVPGSRRKRLAALKRWEDGDDVFATLYTADAVYKFKRGWIGKQDKSPQERQIDEAAKRVWDLREDTGDAANPQRNPLGVVPMVELPNRPMLAADPISDVAGVTAMQDAINLLWAQLFTASDYASFPQRIVLGAEMPQVPILDETGEVVGRRPIDIDRFAVDRVAWFSGENARIDEWSAANLEAYSNIVEVAVGHIAAQTRTPQHYLVGRMANLSGDALIAAETGLVKRVEEKQLWFGLAIREMAALIALARGEDSKAAAIRGGRVVWADAESRSHSQLADALLKLRSIGFPFKWVALRYGLTPTEVAEMAAMREEEAEMDPIGAIAEEAARAQGSTGAAPEDPTDEPE